MLKVLILGKWSACSLASVFKAVNLSIENYLFQLCPGMLAADVVPRESVWGICV